MSLRNEQYRALYRTREFLRELLQPSATPKVPRAIRKEASSCLKHYPFLHKNGEPMFSPDDFPCPAIERVEP